MSVPDVLAGIRAAEVAAGRGPGSVQLVAVTKGYSAEQIQQSILVHGAFALAENKGQELRDKVPLLPGAQWHFIGAFQRNKVKYLRDVTLIHSLEERWQAEAIAEAAQKWGHAPDVLLQMHNGEAQKHGVSPDDLPQMLRDVRATGLNVRGLMVMAPYDQPEAAAQVFRTTAQWAHELGLPELSMGMSDDYPQAIAAGATLVRVGRRLFT
ncbi:YggS family pyridoxal phosphate-dependent enzyme [Deinococcus cavernae]|uniref:YggS family pyridoxal phosphate-dependent enzyme n=1 Tax=Deinococcus cavernae TaxID=2320857 RepID=A0A418VCY3_9DEIO|nr:YggS family pyridoxal phosphate-dependent enzyme [Deinococcus cavernae]RJF73882.1 YggS family pyridoxal phosphate-dependent enzyme [Deinococcus cavernae]